MISADSIKFKLKIQAKSNSRTFQDMLVMYGLERTLYRVSISDYKEKLTLKGGIFLYSLFEGDFARATRDIDFLAHKIKNEINSIKTIFIDIGFGDIVVPDRSLMDYPVILDMKSPNLYVYSIE